MTDEASPRTSIFAAALFLLVAAILIAPIGAIVIDAIADTGGGSASTSVLPDTISDTVAATAAEFRVDESGSTTYSIPLYGVPGTAGVAPKLSLSYSSQGGYGPLGKGWSIGGMSSIARCRATREAGDATAESNPAPINFSATDQYCLDGQRLLAVANSPACAAAGGMGVQQLRTEIESFQRVCAYTPSGGTNGPSFFTVERKDGSTSWYGDRDNNATANRVDGYFETNSPLKPAAALLWAQTRFQDSTGNYIDFIYSENPAGATTREHLISEIRYTGKTVLSGQTGSAKAPYAKITFNYGIRATAQQAKGYSAAGTFDQTRRLDSITSCASGAAGACAAGSQARFYQLTYAAAPSGNGQDTLTSLQECRDSGKTVCMAPTTFAWSAGANEFATIEKPANFSLTSDDIRGFKMADINGDGRLDMVLEYTAGSGCSGGTWIVNALSMLDASGLSTFGVAQYNCVPTNIVSRGNGAWHLFDYNGDGRDDLFVSSATGQGWRVHPSNGTGFDMSTNLAPGVIPSVDDKDSQVQLADLNGDGLTDIVYPNGSDLRARLMERQGAGFVWGVERAVAIDATSMSPCKPFAPPPESRCTRTIGALPTTKTGFMQMADFNGDAASDLLIGVTETVNDWTGNCQIPIAPPSPPEESSLASMEGGINSTVLPYVPQAQAERIAKARAALVGGVNCYITSTHSYLYAFTIKSLTSTSVSLAAYDAPSGINPYAIVLADANGDGLTDAFVRATSSADWAVRINTGAYFLGATMLPLSDYRDQTQFADVNGDGRADMLYVVDSGGNKIYYARYALPGGGFGTGTALPGGNARLCEGSGCNAATRTPIFADVDGDGNLDFLSLAPSLGLYVSRASTRFTPRDVITRITNGLGAQTDITYAPLTNKDLYRRDTGSRNNLNWGRGSPVMDFLAPTYAVARASSSSPQAGVPTAKATVHYRYAGARVQSGGRGFLGFAVIDTIDPNQTGGHVVTTTSYAQNFPFVGMPVQTVKKAVANLAYLLPACLNGTAITNACFATPGQSHTDLGGNWFSDSGQVWESAPAVLTAQVPLHVRTFGTDEKLRDPFTGTQTSEVMTSFGYGTYGNITSTSVQTYTGASTLVSTVATANTYTDDTAKWRLGRLTGSTVTHSRPSLANVVRTSNFAYSTTGAYTGLLTVERSQYGGPVDQDLRKEYTYDDYGNKTIAETCANPATACTTAISFHPVSATAIQRYSKVTYDAIGRFPVATIEPFWNGTGAVEKTVNTVVARNIFGDATRHTISMGSTRWPWPAPWDGLITVGRRPCLGVLPVPRLAVARVGPLIASAVPAPIRSTAPQEPGFASEWWQRVRRDNGLISTSWAGRC